MASVINGSNIILYKYDPITNLSVPFGSATSCSFQSTTDQVEVTSQSSAWYREFKNDIMSWTISCDGFICLNTDYNYLALIGMQQDQIIGQTMTVKFAIDNDNGDGSGDLGLSVFTGIANITSISISGAVEGASTYSVSLQGTGPYVISGTVPTPGGTIITAGGAVYMKSYTAAGGETSITWADMIGKTCLGFTRGGVEVRTINTSGVPTDENVSFNSATGVITFATARPLESDEFIRAIFA
jgi:predicted secreted protein